MILIIGGAGQGKLDYVLQKTGYGPAQVARTPEEARTRPVFAGLEDWPELVGCGVVPVEPAQRARREAVGRLCCRLAERAERVERIFCGLPMVLKGEGPWN